METSDGRTEIVIVLDRSGSMSSCATDTIGGFNHFIQEQKNAPGEAFLTLTQFDTEYEIVHDCKPIKEIPNLDFHPRGGTALLDAIGRTVIATKERFKTQRPGPDVVLFVIITDGQENSSKEFKRDAINAMIKESEATDKWRFIFLGANQDAFAEGGSLGVRGTSTMNYDVRNTSQMYQSLSRNMTRYRNSVADSCSKGLNVMDTVDSLNAEKFFDEEDEANQMPNAQNAKKLDMLKLTEEAKKLALIKDPVERSKRGNELNEKVRRMKDGTDSGIKW